jgi:hypothetical protein
MVYHLLHSPLISVFLCLGSKCYRKNTAHFKEYSHSDTTSPSTTPKVIETGLMKIYFLVGNFVYLILDTKTTLVVCPFGATCYRKNLLHFATYSHPFDLLNPDVDSSDEEENKKIEITTDEKKRKAESDDEKTEEYDSDDVSLCYTCQCLSENFHIGKRV